MKHNFFVHKIQAILTIGLVVAGLLMASTIYILRNGIIETVFCAIIVFTGLFLFNDRYKNGIFDTITISEDGIFLKRLFNKQVGYSPWEDIVKIREIYDGHDGSIKIDSNKAVFNKSHTLYMDYNYEAYQMLIRNFEEKRQK